MRRDFLAVAWTLASLDAKAQADALAADIDDDPAWRRVTEASGLGGLGGLDGLTIWRRGSADIPVRPLAEDAGVVIGAWFPLSDSEGWPDRHGPGGAAQSLLRTGWGPYVALLREEDGPWRGLRDPSGQVPLLTWRVGAVAVAASQVHDLPRRAAPPRMALDWDRIAAFLAVPVAATTPSLFADVMAIGPGELAPLGGGAPVAAWSPTNFVTPWGGSPADLGEAFVARLDQCVAGLTCGHDRILVELSGGLDSACVTAALHRSGQAHRAAAYLNFADPRPEADERRYAEAVARQCGFGLTVVHRAPCAIDLDLVAANAKGSWPAITSVDASVDGEELDRVRASGATGILSGQGGDAVFFDMASALVAADLWRAEGLGRLLGDPRLGQIARRRRSHVWDTLREAHRGLTGTASGPRHVNRLVTDAVRDAVAGTEHAWVQVAASRAVPPGKRVHIRALATSHFNHNPTRRAEAADLLYPLLAQPLVELALSAPTPWLAAAAHSRPFQRKAFADRLPPLVRDRRAKGNVSVYLARMIAQSLPEIRPFLLDGVLVDAGVLDRRRLAAVLDPQHLIQAPAGADLVGAIAVEAWVRHWQTRVPDGPRGRWS